MTEVFVGALIMLIGVLVGFAISRYDGIDNKSIEPITINTSNWPKETHGFGSGNGGIGGSEG